MKSIITVIFLLILTAGLLGCGDRNSDVGIDGGSNSDSDSESAGRPQAYTLEDVIAKGFVVHENLSVISGQDVWDEFVEKTQDGAPCIVMLAFYYTLGDPSQYSPEYYEEIKDDYPLLFTQLLRYDGDSFTLHGPRTKETTPSATSTSSGSRRSPPGPRRISHTGSGMRLSTTTGSRANSCSGGWPARSSATTSTTW